MDEPLPHRSRTGAESLGAEVCRIGREAGLDAVGIASALPFIDARRILEARKASGLAADMAFTYRNPRRSTTPSALIADAESLVVGARFYARRGPETPPKPPAGRVARYSWIDHYAPLREALAAVAGRLRDGGWQARVLADDNALVDRAAAQRAGLGTWGKNANLLVNGRGSYFVLGSVLTNAPLPPSAPAAADPCGNCVCCIDRCPTGAIVAPGVLDARRCLAWLVQARGVFPIEYRAALGDRLYGCDDCQEVCPPNRIDSHRHPLAPAEPDAQPWVEVLELLALDDDALLTVLGRWYVADRDGRYLRRNLLVVLGNTADGDNPTVVAALDSALASPDPLIRAHAVWAAARLGRLDLVDAHTSHEADPMVQAEVAQARSVESRDGSAR